MITISAVVAQHLKTNTNQNVDLIVRTYGDATPHLEWLTTAGLQIKQQFKLSPGVAVSGLGRDALTLLEQDWVKSIELDAPMRAIK